MPTQKYTPMISRLRADLKRKYDDAQTDSEEPPSTASTKGAFDHVSDLDSKTVAKWSSTIKKHRGCNLDPGLIRRGGYASFTGFEVAL